MQDECPKDRVPEALPETSLVSEWLLLLASAIWGFAFVAQRVAMEHVGPFTFNAVRFAIGSIPMLPLIALSTRRARAGEDRVHGNRASGRRRTVGRPEEPQPAPASPGARTVLLCALVVGGTLYGGASFQQFGIVHTTAGKAGFITGLYVIITPILGLFWRMRPRAAAWAGAVLGVVGLFLLTVTERLSMGLGDTLVLVGAFFWAGHVLAVGHFIRKVGVGVLAFIQFLTCSALSFATAVVVEDIRLEGLVAATVPILYAGLISVGIAYTLQLVGQRRTPPAHAAIILGMEAVFAALGGWAVLGETLSARALLGCGLMLAGVVVSQLGQVRKGVRRLKIARVRPVP
jgi:drug/metabolite transporter (DMT)-like permease